ncbi:MAG TPA: hypothetical protein DET40_13670 [Lentisphaeria bacterium]|nr:hypothetical protein [Lentisphaeria bacterium]
MPVQANPEEARKCQSKQIVELQCDTLIIYSWAVGNNVPCWAYAYIKFRVIPQDDGLMDCWMNGLLGLNSRLRIKGKDWERNSKRGISDFMNVLFVYISLNCNNPIIHGTAVY